MQRVIFLKAENPEKGRQKLVLAQIVLLNMKNMKDHDYCRG